MQLNVDISKRSDGALVVALKGLLNSDTYAGFEKQVVSAIVKGATALILDMKLLEYISSMGISAVLNLKKAAEASGARFMMVNLPAQIKEVFRIIKALPDTSVFRDIEEADSYLMEIQRKIQEGAHPATD